jgi:uncharacterized 2Fe-2S/4Fe-4S cluster protein (DUF4445 family)
LTLEPGTPLQDLLFAQGVEFPCGGAGRCKGCRIRVLTGSLAVTEEDHRLLSRAELDAGWRLACRAQPQGDLKLELAQWEAAILSDATRFSFTPRNGLGMAVDLGSTTLVAQLLDLRTGDVLGVRTGLNAQARHGADIMSRIGFALAGDGQRVLERLIREQVGGLAEELLATAPHGGAGLSEVVIVGNTAMHHLFCGVGVEPLSRYPFVTADAGLKVFAAAQLGWTCAGSARVRFLPCLGGFVGSDILAGILATGLHRSEAPQALIDLGTNGEIVVGNRERLLCTSTAAGPAFEGARISMGMRAATGAIAQVRAEADGLRCHVLGHVAPRGICGSGLVDAVAVGLDLGRVQRSGRLTAGHALALESPVVVSQADIRELQLAKGAIAAGIRLLVSRWGVTLADIAAVHLAGAFGNYIHRASARRIGLLPFPLSRVQPAGNTALLGAKLALFNLEEDDGSYREVLARTTHVALKEDEDFQNIFVEEMGFPVGEPE